MVAYAGVMRLRQRVGPTLSGVALAVGVVGCVSDSGGQSNSVALPDGLILMVVPDLSAEPDDVVFAAVPDLLVTDDGRVIYQQPESYPDSGSLVADVWVQSITPDGIELVRAAADEGDAPHTIEELTALVGGALGDANFYFPDDFRFAAVALGPVGEFDDADTPLVEWPDAVSVPLSVATECTRLPELEVGEILVTAAENSLFVDDGIVYGVVAAPDWPGAPC